MATAEAETSRDERAAAGGLVYDGFISYSHAADDLLAPRLQAGLQRFAKPWWKRRALRIFRDEASLSANPHLWSSITTALDGSGWFVLLLSPDAAQSEWVNQEVEYWLEHKDPDRIIPVLTDGKFGWADGDVAGDAVPPALQGAFPDEPRWVDLRSARTEEHLDLQNPAFSAAVADVASALRGVPKDELASEEVRQHRRTVRTAWAAGLVVVALAIAASGAALYASTQRNEASQQRDLARSQELAAASTSVLESDPELATLLAVLSIQQAPGAIPAESVRALRRADQANLLTTRIPFTGLSYVEVTPDGQSVIAFSDALEVASFDLATGAQQWNTRLDDDIDSLIAAAIAPDGSIAVVTGTDEEAGVGKVLVLSLADGGIVEAFTEVCEFAGWLPNGRPFSPDGTVLALGTGSDVCASDPDENWISFRDTTSWQEVAQLQVPGLVETVVFDRNGDFLLSGPEGSANQLELRSYPDLEVLHVIEGSLSTDIALSPTGDRVVLRDGVGLRIHEVATGEFLGWVEGLGLFGSGPPEFSPDGETLLALSEDGKALVDASNGRLVTRLGPNEPTWDASFTPDGRSVVTSDNNKLEVWSLDGAAGTTPLTVNGEAIVHVNTDRLTDGPLPAVHAYAGRLPEDMITWLVVIDTATGETVNAIQTPTSAQLPDGRFVIIEQSPVGPMPVEIHPEQTDLAFGGLAVWDPTDGALIPVTECSVLLSENNYYTADPVTHCDSGEPAFGVHTYGEAGIKVSPDGSMFAADSWVLEGEVCGASSRAIRVWDAGTTDEVATITVDGCEGLEVLGDTWVMTEVAAYDLTDGSQIFEFEETAVDGTSQLTADGRYIIGNSGGALRQAVVIDTTTWSEVARWDAHDARIRGVALSADDARLVTTSEDGVVRIWDMRPFWSGTVAEGQAPPLLDEIPVGIASDAHWISDTALGVILRNGSWTIVSLDADVLVGKVLDRLQRSFTATECQTYRIDPCPTLGGLWGD